MQQEIERIVDVYQSRSCPALEQRYRLTSPAVYMATQERERALLKWIRAAGMEPVSQKRLIEIGCGTGANLLWLLRAGFLPEHLVGNDLLPARVEAARKTLPGGLRVVCGNALELNFPHASFDVVFQSVMFTSILDRQLKADLAAHVWKWIKPGGGVLWYDFVFDNPRNAQVKGISLSEIRKLFPDAKMRSTRVTLAPPIARAVTRIHPSLYTVMNSFPALRSHVLCWIEKA